MKPLRRSFSIAGRAIGSGHPCFVIAEAGVNHNGNLDLARKLVEVAASAGADAVKFQTFDADRLVTADAPKADYQVDSDPESKSQRDMLKRLELPREAHRGLLDNAADEGILFMSTPFDEDSADFLDSLGVAAFKVASAEITNLPFLRHVARKHKPVILSTGMASLAEVRAAVEAMISVGSTEVALLHCVSNYPADPSDVNLRAMLTMAAEFGAPVGFSDHTEGIDIAIGAVALGAAVIEKHITLDRGLPGPDHRASIEPAELANLVRGIRKIEAALGDGTKKATQSEAPIARIARRSIVAARDIEAGSTLTEDSITTSRPGTGLPPAMKDEILGRRLRVDVAKGTILSTEMLA